MIKELSSDFYWRLQATKNIDFTELVWKIH